MSHTRRKRSLETRETQTAPTKRFKTLKNGFQKRYAQREKTFRDLPAEVVERIFLSSDGRTVTRARLVCRGWLQIIDQAPFDLLPKVHFRAITVTAQRGFEIILEKDLHLAADPKENFLPPRPSLTKTAIKNTLKFMDKPALSEITSLPKYLRHLDCRKLTLQSLSNKGLISMLRIFKRLCLGTKVLVFDFCNFSAIQKQWMLDFMRPRENCLMEVQLSSCRAMEDNFTPEEFWKSIGQLAGPFPTIRLKDHYSNSPWMDQLAELILLSDNPPWLLDIDGVSPPQEAVFKRLRMWLASGPDNVPAKLGFASAEEARKKVPRLKGKTAYRRRNVVIKIDNCRGIRLGRFWNDTVREVLEPAKVKSVPKLCKVLEQCFDGRCRYSTHRNRMVIEETDKARFSVYLQR